jgi:hypothetical protein
LKTLVTSPRVTPDSSILMDAAKSVGQPALRLPSFRPPDALREIPIAIYGEALFAIILATQLGHVVIEPTRDWLVQLPTAYRQRDIIKTTLNEARAYRMPRFVKNADGMKAFEAKVYASGDDLPPPRYYSDDYEVLVSEPVIWEIEYRCFILERELVTHSIYLREGELAKSEDGAWLDTLDEKLAARAFCETLLRDVTVMLPPACVVDVGRTEGRGWAVIEANPAFGSGIYGCDPLGVLRVVNRATLRAEDVIDHDKPWVTRYEVGD